jgi:hypothetical protein
VPERPIALKPDIDIGQRRCPDSAGPSLSITTSCHESGRLEDADVLGDSARRHLERLGEFTDRRFSFQKTRQDGASRWIGERCEGCAELIVRHYGTIWLWNHSVL